MDLLNKNNIRTMCNVYLYLYLHCIENRSSDTPSAALLVDVHKRGNKFFLKFIDVHQNYR